mmetsp:Transcript_60783/g.146305  ORF Transcript_60783/g.146305 Transcript_60783/m.146305 type:complete len:208 (-) Transcript_60783:163-786(-)
MRTCRYCHGTGDLPKDVTGLGPVDERDLRPRSKVQSPCDLKNPYCVRVAPSVKGESQTCALGACKRHCRGPLVQTAQYGRAADDPGPELDCVGEHTSRSVCVCSSHIKYGSSHQGWRGDGVVDRVDSAIDQSGGRELAAGIERIYEARHGRRCEGAADVAGDRGHAGGGNAGFGQKCEAICAAKVNRLTKGRRCWRRRRLCRRRRGW